jgi:hypothetical protein
MKRASLIVKAPARPAQPADLTDRLLDRETEGASPAAPRAARPRARAQVPTLAPAAEPSTPAPVLEASPPDAGPALQSALEQAATAAAALDAAARQAPARYDVALRYRLEALGHHLRQVAEFMAQLAGR